jgi:hypothetical protein
MKKAFSVAIAVACVLNLAAVPLMAATESSPPAAVSSSISGTVFQDYCKTNCVAGSGLARGNGVPNDAELRLANMWVGIAHGSCRPSQPVYKWVRTNASGNYLFSGLAAGTYCVMVNSRQSSVAFPKPGVWSRPSGRSSYYLASYTVRLAAGKSRGSLYFGWDRIGAP